MRVSLVYPWLALGLLSTPAVAGDAVELEDVVVTGSRTEHAVADAPVATEVIDRATIASSGAENLAELLSSHAGMDLYAALRGTGLRIQGLGAEHLLILVDGQRMVGRLDGVLDLSRFPTESIERVEIVKGPSSALYGSDAMGGVVHIITRKARAPQEAELRARYGSRRAVDVDAGAGLVRGPVSVRLHGGYHRHDAWRRDGSSVATSGSRLSAWDVGHRTVWTGSGGARLTATTHLQISDHAGVDANAAGAVFDRRNRTRTLNAQLAPEFLLPRGGRLRLMAAYAGNHDEYLLDQRGSAALDQHETTREHLGELDLQYERLFGGRHLLVAGAHGQYERLASPRVGPGEGDRGRVSVFAQNEWSATDEPLLVVVPGVRADVDTRFGVHVTPKLALRLDPVERLTIRASYGRGFRAPDFKELLLRFENPGVGYRVDGNSSLRPETSHGVNLAFEVRATGWLGVSASGFWNRVDNLIAIESVESGGGGGPQRFSYGNIGRATTRGGELTLRLTPTPGLSVDTAWTLTDTVDHATGRPLEGRALHRGTLDLRWRMERWGTIATLRAAVESRRPFYAAVEGAAPTTRYAGASALLGVRLAKRFGTHLSIFAGADNLLDAGDPVLMPIAGRSFYAGLEARL
ncbi:MAG: TonB-dependent receptor [Myxococcota bacterium]